MTKPLMPIVKRSLDLQAADWLLDSIIEGRLAPGKPVMETVLAEEVGLSRSTVRTALQRLSSDGLILQRPYEGWEVIPFTIDDIRYLYATRGALESLAAGLAARAVTAQGRADLAEAMDILTEAVERHQNKRAVAEADLNLHLAIARISNNKRLISYCEQMNKSILLYIVSANRRTPAQEMIQCHQALVDAICEGRAEEAQVLMAAHIAEAASRLKEDLRTDKAKAPALSRTR
jgi:DNA-binding GntR family transcriptional regulator